MLDRERKETPQNQPQIYKGKAALQFVESIHSKGLEYLERTQNCIDAMKHYNHLRYISYGEVPKIEFDYVRGSLTAVGLERRITKEETERILENYAIINVPYTIIVVGGAAAFDDTQLHTIATQVQDCDEVVNTLIERPVKDKVCLFYEAEDMHGISYSQRLSFYFEVGPDKKIFLPDGRFNPDLRNTTAHELAHFYGADYELMHHPREFENPAWESLIYRAKSCKSGRDLGAPDVILNNGERLLLEGIKNFFVDLGEPNAEPLAKEAFAQIGPDYDLQLSPLIKDHKKFFDWLRIYSEGFATVVGAVVSGKTEKDLIEEAKKELERSVSRGDITIRKGEIPELNWLSERVTPTAMGYDIIPSFLYHLHDHYGLTIADLAHAVGKVQKQNFDLNYFCGLFGIDYQKPLKTWQARLAA